MTDYYTYQSHKSVATPYIVDEHDTPEAQDLFWAEWNKATNGETTEDALAAYIRKHLPRLI